MRENKIYGLIGKNIDYSFSKNFFSKKFKKENINCKYLNFDIQNISEFKSIIYDKNISIAVTASKNLDQLTSSRSLEQEFKRTISRLYQLTSNKINI